MELQELKYFLLVMECGSFSKAAEKGFTTQPNISKNIAALENSLQVTLFQRKRNGVVPTPEAIALSKRLRVVMDQMDNLFTQPHKEEKNLGELCIGFTENMDINIVAASFFQALKSNPRTKHVPIRLQSCKMNEIIPGIEKGNIDLGFVYSVLSVDSSKFNRIAMTREKPRLYYSSKHELAKKENLSIDDFKEATFVLNSYKSDPNYIRFGGLPFKPAHVIFVDSLMEISLYVNSGMGVTILGPSQILQSASDTCYLEIENAHTEVGTDAIWLNNNKKDLLKYVIPCLM